MLKEYTADDIAAWEANLLASLSDVRKIRHHMEEAGAETVRVEATRANELIAYLRNWAIGAEAKVRMTLTRSAVAV